MTLAPKVFESISCAVCGGTHSEPISSTGQFGWETHVSICPTCGFVYLNPRWRKADYDYFYTVEYDQFYREDSQMEMEKEKRKAQTVWKRLEAHTPHQFEAALDIGCGFGWVLDTIARHQNGMLKAGIEPSDTCVAYFTDNIGGELVARDVDSDWHLDQQGRFDLVVMRHVIEHLLDPLHSLEKIQSVLNEDGVLYIGCPDMLEPSGSLEKFWFRNVHTNYFSAVTLERLAARAGLEPVVIQSEDAELWAIFRQARGPIGKDWPSVYDKQMQVLRDYRRKRQVRRVVRAFNPAALSRLVPGFVKDLFPEDFKRKFRNLIYRH